MAKIQNSKSDVIFKNSLHTVNHRISPLGAYLFLIFLDGGLFEGGALYEGRGGL